MNILTAGNLIKEYPVKGLVSRVINDIDIDIAENDFTAIKGESGSGKSTLLYLLSGFEKPTSGTVEFCGRNLAAMTDKQTAKLRRTEMSFIYQFYNLLPNISLYDNIALPKRIDRNFGESDKRYLEELAAFAGVSDVLGKLPAEVSGGEQQRAAIIRALIIRPKILFADEPTGNLDSKSGQAVMDLLAAANRDYNTAVVMVTHSAEHAAAAKKIITLKDGKILNTDA